MSSESDIGLVGSDFDGDTMEYESHNSSDDLYIDVEAKGRKKSWDGHAVLSGDLAGKGPWASQNRS